MIDTRDTQYPRYDSLFLGEVTDRDDPLHLGRVRVRVAGLLQPESSWAYPIGMMLGIGQGLWAVPDVGSNVCVFCNQGDTQHPYYIPGPFGAPTSKSTGKPVHDSQSQNTSHVSLKWRDLELLLDGTKGLEKIKLLTKLGHKIVMDDSPGSPQVLIKTADSHQLLMDGLLDKINMSLDTGPYLELDKPNFTAVLKTNSQSVELLDNDLKILLKSVIGDIEMEATNSKQTFQGKMEMSALLQSTLTFVAGITIAATAGAAVISGLSVQLAATAAGGIILGLSATALRIVNETFLTLYNANVGIHNANMTAHNANVAVLATHVHPFIGNLGVPGSTTPSLTPPVGVMGGVTSANVNAHATKSTVAS